jgi:hypothetical protein
MCKIGDHVKVKDGTVLVTEEIVNNWAGEITEL